MIPFNKTFIILVLIFTVTAVHSFAQFSVKILNESFNSNAMRWDIRNDEYAEMDIQLGKYTILNKTDGTAITSTIESPHIQYDGFHIKAKISKIKGIENNGFGLVWGSADASNEFEFVISANGYFKIVKWEQGQKKDLIEWTYQTAINKWDFNTNELMIESDGIYYRYYINDTYVALTNYSRPFGNRLGFVLNENIEVEIDEFIIENVTKSVFTEQVSSSFQDVKFGKIEFESLKHGNVLYYNDTARLNIELIKSGNTAIKDLMLIIKTDQNENNILFNSLHIIELDKKSTNKFVSVELVTDESVKSQSINFTIQIKTPENELIDVENMHVQAVGISSYTNDYTNYSYKPDNQNNNQGNNSNQGSQVYQNSTGCAKSCVWSGLISVLIGVILTIL